MSEQPALERALVRSAFINPKFRNKLRKIPRDAWLDFVARDIALRLVSGQPVLDEHLNALGTQTLEAGMIEKATEEIVSSAYFRDSQLYARNILAQAELGDLGALQSAMDNRPSTVGMGGSEHVSEITHALIEMALSAGEGESGSGNIVIPFATWHEAWGGLAAGSLHVIAGDPGGGKSAVVEQLEMALADPSRSGPNVGVMSMEMRREFKMARYAQHLYGADVGPRAVLGGKADQKLLASAMGDLRDYRLFIDDTKYQRYGLVDAMYAMKDQHDIGYFTVDFLQLIQPYKGETKYDNTTYNVNAVFDFARDANVPVILISQMNREGRKLAERPRMTDLEGSGAIEQLAWTVNFMWDKDRMASSQGSDSRIWVIDKNRNGPAPVELGKMGFNGKYMNLDIR